MCFKEASQEEIESPDMVKKYLTSTDVDGFQVAATTKLLLRNTTKSGLFHFYPISFDTGYFSSLSVCVTSIVKEFKFKQMPLFDELKARCSNTKEGKKQIMEPIDSKKQIKSPESRKLSNGDASFAEQVTQGRKCLLTKIQILSLQKVYLETLAQVYKQARTTFLKALK